MNKVQLLGRLTRDPEVRYSQGETPTCIARYTLAVNRRITRDGEATADFINCVAFGRQGEFAEKYLHKGTKICLCGRIQTGSYTNRDGVKIYTTDIIVEEQEFAESKAAGNSGQAQQAASQAAPQAAQQAAPAPDMGSTGGYDDGFIDLDFPGDDLELPFR